MEFINSFISSNDVAIDVSQKGGNNHITLELGDIIEIVSPSNDELHEMTFLITYIDLSEFINFQIKHLKISLYQSNCLYLFVSL